MRTFGSALLGRGGRASVALAGIPYMTCSVAEVQHGVACTGNSPTWHLTGTVIAAGLSGASLVLARTAARTREYGPPGQHRTRLADLQRELARRRRQRSPAEGAVGS